MPLVYGEVSLQIHFWKNYFSSCGWLQYLRCTASEVGPASWPHSVGDSYHRAYTYLLLWVLGGTGFPHGCDDERYDPLLKKYSNYSRYSRAHGQGCSAMGELFIKIYWVTDWRMVSQCLGSSRSTCWNGIFRAWFIWLIEWLTPYPELMRLWAKDEGNHEANAIGQFVTDVVVTNCRYLIRPPTVDIHFHLISLLEPPRTFSWIVFKYLEYWISKTPKIKWRIIMFLWAIHRYFC